MAGTEQLPPDQRAVLQLLLKQGRSYDDLSSVLHMDAQAVRDRAHLALEALGPDTDLSDQHLEQISDYLLGQLPASGRSRTRDLLAGSAAGRAWARVVAGELRPLAPESLPEIPAEGEEVEEAFDALEARRERRQEVERSSKLGGILLLAGLGIALAVVIVLLIGGGGDDEEEANGGNTTPPAATQQPSIVGQVNLLPPGGEGSAAGLAQLLDQSGQPGIRIVAEGLDAVTEETAYGLWLYNSENEAELLGFPQQQPTQQQPLLAAQDELPDNVGQFESLVLTREPRRETPPSSPGDIVLRGQIEQAPAGGQGGGGQGGGGQGGG